MTVFFIFFRALGSAIMNVIPNDTDDDWKFVLTEGHKILRIVAMTVTHILLMTRFVLRRVTFVFLAVLLCLQLVALTQHHHDLQQHPDNCSACSLANNFSGGTPTTPLPTAVLILVVAYLITRNTQKSVYTTPHQRLLPPSQAPPYY